MVSNISKFYSDSTSAFKNELAKVFSAPVKLLESQLLPIFSSYSLSSLRLLLFLKNFFDELVEFPNLNIPSSFNKLVPAKNEGLWLFDSIPLSLHEHLIADAIIIFV